MAETLTKEDIKKIEAEIEERKLVLRPQLIEAVKEARAHGDLSENFEYYAAKREKNKNESRINYLERMLRFCNVYEDKTEDDQVGIDKVVELYFEEDDESEKFKIVTAIVGKKKGDRVRVPVGDGGYFVKIMSIEISNDEDEIRSF